MTETAHALTREKQSTLEDNLKKAYMRQKINGLVSMCVHAFSFLQRSWTACCQWQTIG